MATGWAHAVSEPTRDSTPDASIMRIDEPRYLGRQLPGDIRLEDAGGKTFQLGDTRGKPLILLLSYYGCDGTCPTMGVELAKVLGRVKRFRLGQDYRVLTVSFDRRDTAHSASEFVGHSPTLSEISGSGWRHAVLKGEDAAEFAGQVGFRFFWSDAAAAFLHPNVLVFITPEGRVARYIYGTRMDPQTVELALIDADWERIASSTAVFDQLTGACFSYNYAEGRYQLNYSLLAGVGSLISGVLMLGLGAWVYRRRVGGASHG